MVDYLTYSQAIDAAIMGNMVARKVGSGIRTSWDMVLGVIYRQDEYCARTLFERTENYRVIGHLLSLGYDASKKEFVLKPWQPTLEDTLSEEWFIVKGLEEDEVK